ncbi:hypothetical protein RND71_005598 [Anisodus tanguticus]|uniref:eRF1 domain-containing protein n=1 Tax=Anisodus tanguticus TaxID=243964 RepID=A0AAE1VSI3_9SOLA|nr:hypothetical protein RND71_005598 [Anisodus tanguticus]
MWLMYLMEGKMVLSFNQAIKLSAKNLGNVKFIQEINIIGKYFEEISQDSGKYVVGLNDTLKVLETGVVETLIVWKNLDVTRYILKNNNSGETIIKHLNKEQEADQSNCRDPATNAELEIKAKMPLLECLSNEYKKFGCNLEFVTNKSQEGSQFCRGFGVKREACSGTRGPGPGPDSGTDALSNKLLGACQMDGMHEEKKLLVISSRSSKKCELILDRERGDGPVSQVG